MKVFFQIRIFAEKLGPNRVGRQDIEDTPHRDSHAPNTGFASALVGLYGDPIKAGNRFHATSLTPQTPKGREPESPAFRNSEREQSYRTSSDQFSSTDFTFAVN